MLTRLRFQKSMLVPTKPSVRKAARPPSRRASWSRPTEKRGSPPRLEKTVRARLSATRYFTKNSDASNEWRIWIWDQRLNVVLDETIPQEAERMIESCEGCNREGALASPPQI